MSQLFASGDQSIGKEILREEWKRKHNIAELKGCSNNSAQREIY